MRFASRIGFNPPYFYNRHAAPAPARFTGPALLLWGEDDRMVPRAHAEAYARASPTPTLRIIAGAGHSPQVERPAETAALINTFLRPPAATRKAAAKAKAVAAAPKAKAKATAKAKAKARAAVHRSRTPVSTKTGRQKRQRH